MDVTCREIRKVDFDRGKRSEIQWYSNFAYQLISTAVRATGRQQTTVLLFCANLRSLL